MIVPQLLSVNKFIIITCSVCRINCDSFINKKINLLYLYNENSPQHEQQRSPTNILYASIFLFFRSAGIPPAKKFNQGA